MAQPPPTDIPTAFRVFPDTLPQQNFDHAIDSVGQPIFPIEIAEYIIDQLGIDLLFIFTSGEFGEFDHHASLCLSLRNCALTCKAWRPRSYYYLYRQIWLDSRVVDVLRKNVELCKSVHRLIFLGSLTPVRGLLPLTGPGKLSSIRALSFVGCTDMVQHKYFPMAFMPFSHTITVLTLLGMSLNGRDYHRILCALPSLACLTTKYDIPDVSPPNQTGVKGLKAPKCRLKCLAIHISPGKPERLCGFLTSIPCCISALESLLIRFPKPGTTDLWPNSGNVYNLIAASFVTLRTFAISFSGSLDVRENVLG
ncbi:unnamed protein product [Somion occarium]|uniref:F-box domain-containing protein n=1 Tax=Somion occarium TaxID=3059160 RepID=A0ABP1CV91_9APHY